MSRQAGLLQVAAWAEQQKNSPVSLEKNSNLCTFHDHACLFIHEHNVTSPHALADNSGFCSH